MLRGPARHGKLRCREQNIRLRRRMCCGGTRRMLAAERRRFRPSAVARNPCQGVAPDSWALGIIRPGDSNAAGQRDIRSAQTWRSNGALRSFAEARATPARLECLSKLSIRFGYAPALCPG